MHTAVGVTPPYLALPQAVVEGDAAKAKDDKKGEDDDDGSESFDDDHRLAPYEMPSVLCSKCSMYGPSMQTGNKECIDCKLCEKCCEKVRWAASFHACFLSIHLIVFFAVRFW